MLMIWYKLYKSYCPIIYRFKNKRYSDNIFTLDVETTSLFKIGGDWQAFDYNIGNKDYLDIDKRAILYAWGLSIDGICYYGRTLDELKEFIEMIRNDDFVIVIHIHNLSFEFQWLLNIIDDLNPFARKAHKVIKAFSKKYNIEFRCTYMQTNMSLENLPKRFNLQVVKLVGALDYNKVRTPDTDLGYIEYMYLQNDNLVVYEYIKLMRKEYKHIRSIPLTQTGKVRKVVKDLYKKDNKYFAKLNKMIPCSAIQLQFAVKCFAGGYTHANALLSNTILTNYLSVDSSSHYPAQMAIQLFPVSSFIRHDIYDINKLKYAWMGKVKLYNVKSHMSNTYISLSKCEDFLNPIIDNGRVVSADFIVIYLVDLDLDIINKAYTYDKIDYLEGYISKKGYLDSKYINYMLDMYQQKTLLKGSDDVITYNNLKQFINALYGMFVTNNYKDEVIFDMYSDLMWQPVYLSLSDIDDKMQKDIKRKKVFLNYYWGIWVTAYGRKELWDMLTDYGLDDYVAYMDTDSLKVKDCPEVRQIIDDRNKDWTDKLTSTPWDYDKLSPKDKNGIRHPMGVMEYEADNYAKQFITLGAKKYAYVNNDDVLKVTISGVSKKTGAKKLQDINNFMDGFEFGYESGKYESIYGKSDDIICVIDYQGHKSYINQPYWLCLKPTTYTLSLGESYQDYLIFVNSLNANCAKVLGGYDLEKIKGVFNV